MLYDGQISILNRIGFIPHGGRGNRQVRRFRYSDARYCKGQFQFIGYLITYCPRGIPSPSLRGAIWN